MARSWVMKILGSDKHNRIALNPNAGLGLIFLLFNAVCLSAPESKVRIVTGLLPIASATFL